MLNHNKLGCIFKGQSLAAMYLRKRECLCVKKFARGKKILSLICLEVRQLKFGNPRLHPLPVTDFTLHVLFAHNEQ